MKNADNNSNSPKGAHRKSDNYLGQILRARREDKELSQGDLASALGIRGSAISNFEQGQRLPSLTQVAKLSAELGLDLQTLVLARTYDEVCSDDPRKWAANAVAQRDNLLERLRRLIQDTKATASAEKLKERLGGRSFLEFPEAFYPLRVVTGDLRQDPPKTAGDIGAYSACPIDDRWIYRLGLRSDTEKISDKEFVISDSDRLSRVYGNCNLLVVGSPASNHLARIINNGVIFRFNLPKELREKLNKLLEGLPGEKDREVLERKKRDNLDDLKQLMRRFHASYGIVDPVLKDVRGFALAPDVDFATVTFGVNPYYQGDDFRYVTIMVAGFHHPGTVWALRRLGDVRSDKRIFLKRPYGGVLEIKISPEYSWEDRMRHITCSWDTEEYDQQSLLDGLDELQRRESGLMQIDPAEVEQCKQLLRSL